MPAFFSSFRSNRICTLNLNRSENHRCVATKKNQAFIGVKSVRGCVSSLQIACNFYGVESLFRGHPSLINIYAIKWNNSANFNEIKWKCLKWARNEYVCIFKWIYDDNRWHCSSHYSVSNLCTWHHISTITNELQMLVQAIILKIRKILNCIFKFIRLVIFYYLFRS